MPRERSPWRGWEGGEEGPGTDLLTCALGSLCRWGHSPVQSNGPWPSWQVETDGSARRTVRAVSRTMMSKPSACLDRHKAFSPALGTAQYSQCHWAF